MDLVVLSQDALCADANELACHDRRQIYSTQYVSKYLGMTTLIYLALTSRAKRRARLEFLCGIPSEIALRQSDRHIRFCGWRAVSLVAESLRFIGQSKAISDGKLREQIQCAQEQGSHMR